MKPRYKKQKVRGGEEMDGEEMIGKGEIVGKNKKKKVQNVDRDIFFRLLR